MIICMTEAIKKISERRDLKSYDNQHSPICHFPFLTNFLISQISSITCDAVVEHALRLTDNPLSNLIARNDITWVLEREANTEGTTNSNFTQGLAESIADDAFPFGAHTHANQVRRHAAILGPLKFRVMG